MEKKPRKIIAIDETVAKANEGKYYRGYIGF